MSSPTQRNRPIQVATPLGDDTLLFYRMNGYERLGELFEYELELLSEDPAIDPDRLLGENVTVGLVLADGSWRYFNGYVTRFGQYGALDIFSYYRATLRPWLWFLTRAANCRIFQNKTVPEIVKQVFGGHDFTDLKERLTGTYAPREYCVQYRETDFNFVSRLMEEEGIYYYFTHEDGQHHLVLADSASAHEPFPGYAAIPYHPEEGATDRSRADHIHGWGFAKEVQPGAYALADYDFKKPKADLAVKSAIQRGHAHAGYEFFDYPGQYSDAGTGDRYARHRIEEHQARHERCDGTGNARGLAVGCAFTLEDFPRQDQNRGYLVVSASYRMQMDDYLSSGHGSGLERTFECGFSALAQDQPYRPPRVTPKPLVHGAQTALVVGPKGEEVYTDPQGHGMVKVQFHWDRYGQRDQDSSCWVRVSQPWAGKGWGMIALPRVGQEVIVEFLEGDPDQPIITGGVYNAASMPPYALPGNAHISTIKTNSTKGGGGFNELRFNDKKGGEQIFMHAERNLDLRVKASAFEWVGGERHVIVKKDALEQVEGDRHATVKGDSNQAVGGTLSLKADQDLQAKVGMKHALDAGLEIHLKAGMNVVIEAGTSITLKAGGGFVVVGPAGVTISGTPVLINSGGAAGSGSGAAPDAPKPPKEAASDRAGSVDEAKAAPRPPTPKTYGPSATVLKLAALYGTPFCEICGQ